jgi:3',5'-cyclic AMP phosphodiesterase CpdA
MSLTRREVLTAGAALGAGTLPLMAQTTAPDANVVLRVAHLTDTHVQPGNRSSVGTAAAMQAARRFRPNLYMFGGDLINDALGSTKQSALDQFAAFKAVVAANAGNIPVRYCIGNHDVWGWNNIAQYQNDPDFGKRIALNQLGLAAPYYSFDQNGWRIIVLDGTHRKASGGGYTARLDDIQFNWLSATLAATPTTTHVLIVSHMPILGVSPYFDGNNETSGNWVVPGAWMHIDARRIKDLFKSRPQVKACLSGHIHLVDEAQYLGVKYFCNGAVSGGWWGGNYQEFGPGFAIVDLYADGSVRNNFVSYKVP